MNLKKLANRSWRRAFSVLFDTFLPIFALYRPFPLVAE